MLLYLFLQILCIQCLFLLLWMIFVLILYLFLFFDWLFFYWRSGFWYISIILKRLLCLYGILHFFITILLVNCTILEPLGQISTTSVLWFYIIFTCIFYIFSILFYCVFWRILNLNTLIFRLNCIRHLRVYSIFSLVSPIFDSTLRFIQSDWCIFRDMISRNIEIYTTYCDFLNPLFFIINGNSYAVLYWVFINIYYTLANHYL